MCPRREQITFSRVQMQNLFLTKSLVSGGSTEMTSLILKATGHVACFGRKATAHLCMFLDTKVGLLGSDEVDWNVWNCQYPAAEKSLMGSNKQILSRCFWLFLHFFVCFCHLQGWQMSWWDTRLTHLFDGSSQAFLRCPNLSDCWLVPPIYRIRPQTYSFGS